MWNMFFNNFLFLLFNLLSELPVLFVSVTEQAYWKLSGDHSLCLGFGGGQACVC